MSLPQNAAALLFGLKRARKSFPNLNPPKPDFDDTYNSYNSFGAFKPSNSASTSSRSTKTRSTNSLNNCDVTSPLPSPDGKATPATPAYRGVTQRPSGKWQAQVYYLGKSRYIGVFQTMGKASLAYEMARDQLRDGRGDGGDGKEKVKLVREVIRKRMEEEVEEKERIQPYLPEL
ncbi:hypothetical protein TrCOL_g4978 [Triparma columacea]|uniref:AP2/ERF domain-containing protein n=1 Tax=Triparma columacea TaxID=722753 RepID=A0A9W7FW86_9STRA|nr:hypothetical protein TrCOL_g4978 [Triparma columacea]